MNQADAKKWAKLTFVYRKNHVILRYEDGYGNTVRSEGSDYRQEEVNWIVPLRIPSAIEKFLKEVIEAKPLGRDTMQGVKNIPLALFIHHELPNPFKVLFFKYLPPFDREFFASLFPVVLTGDNHQVINFVRTPPRQDFSLPFNIRFAGSLAGEMITVLREKKWFYDNQTVESHGVTLKTIDDLPNYQEKGVDILVVSDEWAQSLSSLRYQLKLNPRLIVVLGKINYLAFYPLARTVLFAPDTDQKLRTYLEDFFYSIIHDFPLHESVQFANNKMSPYDDQGILFASPASNHSLRISEGLESFKLEVNNYSKVINPGNLDNFITRITDANEFEFSKTLRNAFPTASASGYTMFPSGNVSGYTSYFERIRNFGDNFNKETSGLVPLSYEHNNFRLVQPELDQVHGNLNAIVNNSNYFKILRQHQERKLDVTIDYLNSSLIYVPQNKNYALVSNDEYRLNVTIGQPSVNSVVVGEVGAIDPLLPDPKNAKGHELEIVVFKKDFGLLSEASKKIYLPLFGGTDAAQFIIKAPADKSLAELRIGVFYQNNLLQAFLLQAEVMPQQSFRPSQAVKVIMDLSNTEKFTNIEEIRKRNLFIGLNSNGGGSHTLFIKKDSIVEEIKGLSDALIDKAQTDFKSLLKNAYFDATGQIKFSSYAQPGAVISEEFNTEIRKFARFGEKYLSQLFDSVSDTLQDELDHVRGEADLDIQIARYDPNYSFPWAMLYDYITPPNIYGANDYPVCMGHPFAEGQYTSFKNKEGFGCPHNPNTQCFCIEGFWGIRHRLEQVFKRDQPADSRTAVQVKQDSKIYFTYNNEDDDALKLLAELKEHTPVVETVDPSMNLMEKMWDDETRPIMLIVLGHLQTKTEIGEPDEPRILMFPRNKWTLPPPIPQDKFVCYDLLYRYNRTKKRWKSEPFPIVLLINCDVAQMDVRSLNNIVSGFNTAGAGAVIGTEAEITSGLAARFVREILQGLYNEKLPLGESIQNFNRNLALSGNPLAFVFTCYGNINLKIVN